MDVDMDSAVAIDPETLERCVRALAEPGRVGETGVCRPTYTPAWSEAQRIVMDWAREAGMAVRMDAVGNVWGRVEGTGGGKAVVSGSHIDSQCPGGRYDGALGVISAFLAISALVRAFGPPRRPVELLSLCEEEGSRYPTAGFWGSRAIAGRIAPGDPDRVPANDGGTIADGMRAVGLDPARCGEARRDDIAGFLELHIEQGPLLEDAGVPVAVVTGITGRREYRVEVAGRADHAGARPMASRLDPMPGAAEIVLGAIANAEAMGAPAVTTIGRIAAEPGAAPIVPERVTLSIDARHPDEDRWRELCGAHERMMREVAARRGLGVSWEVVGEIPPRPCDPEVVEALEQAASARGVPWIRMASGAAHDAQQLALVAPVGMLFVQSRDGRSHTPEEFTATEHAVAGVEVLASALHRLAW